MRLPRRGRHREKRVQTSNIVELFKEARAQGFKIVMPAGGRERIDRNLALIANCCMRFDLRPAEGRILAKLMRGGLVTRKELHAALGNPLAKSKNVDVNICGLRKKLARYGIKIISLHRLGYRLDKNAPDKIRKLLAETQEV
jgi:hypothetical protein